MSKTIGFFGDSFCAEVSNHHSIIYGYKTYMKRLAEYYDANVVNVGHGGTGVWDILLIQLDPFLKSNTIPDICVFVWPIPGRLFHRKIRRLNQADALYPKLHTYNPLKRHVWKAAKEFYENLYDQEKEELEHLAAMRYIDQVVLSKFPSSVKIVHMWAVGNVQEWSVEGTRPSNVTYPYTWINGSEIRPSLLSLSMYDSTIDVLQTDHRCNHLDGDFKNETLFNWIKLAINNPNSFCDYTVIADKLYDKSQVAGYRAT